MNSVNLVNAQKNLINKVKVMVIDVWNIARDVKDHKSLTVCRCAVLVCAVFVAGVHCIDAVQQVQQVNAVITMCE